VQSESRTGDLAGAIALFSEASGSDWNDLSDAVLQHDSDVSRSRFDLGPPLLEGQELCLNEHGREHRNEIEPVGFSFEPKSMSSPQFWRIRLRQQFGDCDTARDIELHGSGPPPHK
jgi:hypothetical protein